ncbi:MAG: helix-turn-helix transcriptional regulator [Bauldia sp.]|nr:helix-turn-helix transcriptional regulator [Bauldia sp.]
MSATFDHLPEFCRPTADILSRVGDKWTIAVFGALRDGKRRFGELQREVGAISERMLAVTLRNLERDGLVMRTVHPTIPPRVEYELTERGRSLLGELAAIGEWATAHHAGIEESRRRFGETAAPAAAEAADGAPA